MARSRLCLQPRADCGACARAAAQLAQWLRLSALWGPGSRILPERVTRWSRDGLLCRVHLTVSLGLLQPFFLLLALLLCRSALRRALAAATERDPPLVHAHSTHTPSTARCCCAGARSGAP